MLLGQQMRFGTAMRTMIWYTIVGVAANVKNGGLTGEEEPEYYGLRRNRAEDWDEAARGVGLRWSWCEARSRPTEMSRWIRSQVAALDPTLPVDIATLRQRVAKLADQPRFQTTLVSFFAATGLVLAMIGLYGVIAYLVAQRTQEIGVRMALGADKGDILRLVMGRSLRLIVSGIAFGLVAALGRNARAFEPVVQHWPPRSGYVWIGNAPACPGSNRRRPHPSQIRHERESDRGFALRLIAAAVLHKLSGFEQAIPKMNG